MRIENTWQEIRDHSFIQNHSRPFRFTDPWRCFFSSVNSCSSGFRSENSCSPGFRSEDRNGRRRSLLLCSLTHFCVVFEVCVWIIARLEDYCPIISFLIESVTCWFVYLLVFDKIYDVMHLNKMSRTFSRNIGPQHQKYSSIFHCTHGVLFIPVFIKPILSVCC